MSLLKIRNDLQTYFDEEKKIDENAGIFQYSITTPDGIIHNFYLDASVHMVGFTMVGPSGSIMGITVNKVIDITCTRTDEVVKFNVYQASQDAPVAEFMVKPSVFMSSDR